MRIAAYSFGCNRSRETAFLCAGPATVYAGGTGRARPGGWFTGLAAPTSVGESGLSAWRKRYFLFSRSAPVSPVSPTLSAPVRHPLDLSAATSPGRDAVSAIHAPPRPVLGQTHGSADGQVADVAGGFPRLPCLSSHLSTKSCSGVTISGVRSPSRLFTLLICSHLLAFARCLQFHVKR